MKLILGNLQWVMTKRGLVRANALTKEDTLFSLDKPYKISKIEKVKNPLTSITLVNGNSIILGEENQLYSTNGWTKLKDLKKKQNIISSLETFPLEDEVQPIPQTSKKIKMPIFLDEEVAFFFGMLLAFGTWSESGILFTSKIEEARIKYKELLVKLFEIEPKISKDYRENRQESISFFSKDFSDFLEIYFGTSISTRKIPFFISQASQKIQISFINGLTLKSYNYKKSVMIYGGTSKSLAEYLSITLRHLKYQITASHQKKGDKNYFYIMATGADSEALSLKEDLKWIHSKTGNYMCIIDDLKKDIKSTHPNFRTWQTIKRQKRKSASSSVLKRLEVPHDDKLMLQDIKNVEKLGLADAVEIEIDAPEVNINQFLII